MDESSRSASSTSELSPSPCGRIHSALFPRTSASYCSTQSCTCGFSTSVSPLLNALYPSRNKHFRRDRLVPRGGSFPLPMSFVFDVSDFRLQQGRASTMRQHTKEEKRETAKMVRRFLFVCCSQTNYPLQKSKLSSTWPNARVPLHIHLVLGVDTETLAVAISLGSKKRGEFASPLRFFHFRAW